MVIAESGFGWLCSAGEIQNHGLGKKRWTIQNIQFSTWQYANFRRKKWREGDRCMGDDIREYITWSNPLVGTVLCCSQHSGSGFSSTVY